MTRQSKREAVTGLLACVLRAVTRVESQDVV